MRNISSSIFQFKFAWSSLLQHFHVIEAEICLSLPIQQQQTLSNTFLNDYNQHWRDGSAAMPVCSSSAHEFYSQHT